MGEATAAPKYLSAKQLSERTGYSVRFFQELAAAGKLTWARQPAGPRGRWMFDAGAFDAWWASGSVAHRTLSPADYRLIDAEQLEQKTLASTPAGSVVYFMLSAPHVKIGVTANLAKRVSEIRLGNPRHVRLIGVVAGDAALERALHKRFDEKHDRGEWFVFDNVIWDYVREHCHG